MTVAKLSSDLFVSYKIVPVMGASLEKTSNYDATKVIKPYVPKDASDFSQTLNPNSSEWTIDRIKDPLFPLLGPKDIANFSEVSKGCYSIAKCESIWLFQLNKSFSNVNSVSIEKFGFDVKKQFEIIFKRVQDEKKPFVDQYKRNEADLLRLLGPNGDDGELQKAKKRHEEITLKEKGGHRSMDGFTVKLESGAYQLWRIELVGGKTYNGTRGTISPESLQGKLLTAIEQKVPEHFNNQQQFEEVILASKVAKKELEQASEKS
jgi:hypothetical protein